MSVRFHYGNSYFRVSVYRGLRYFSLRYFAFCSLHLKIYDNYSQLGFRLIRQIYQIHATTVQSVFTKITFKTILLLKRNEILGGCICANRYNRFNAPCSRIDASSSIGAT